MKILFVCTGNICRSPTAEAVLRHRLASAGMEKKVVVDSAGTHNYHAGDCPDPRSVATAKPKGIRLENLKARGLRKQDFYDFDLILAMDDGHHSFIKNAAPPDATAEIALFLDYAGHRPEKIVPDPYYGTQKDFDLVLSLSESGVTGLIKKLLPRLQDD